MTNDDEVGNEVNCNNSDDKAESILSCERVQGNDTGITNEIGTATTVTTNNIDPPQSNIPTKSSNPTHNKRDGGKLEEELQHLNRKMQHIQESIKFSSSTTALSDPQTWQINCLFAVKNCVYEWRNIVNFHFLPPPAGGKHTDNTKTSADDDVQVEENEEEKLLRSTNDVLRPPESEQNETYNDQRISTTSLKVFGLIQMALQVGPLKGSNPGYFKRCGSDVARMAHGFLTECVSCTPHLNGDIIMNELRFTERQSAIIQKWIKNAAQAERANNAPSKSALKLQNSATSKKSQKKKKKKKR